MLYYIVIVVELLFSSISSFSLPVPIFLHAAPSRLHSHTHRYTKLIRKWQSQWKVVCGLYVFRWPVVGITLAEKTKREKRNRQGNGVYSEATIKLFPGLSRHKLLSDIHTSINLTIYNTRNRFIYYVPCDPLVPYPFFSFVSLFLLCVCSVPICLRYNLFISCMYISRIIFCCSLYVRCDLMRGGLLIHNFLFFTQ